MIGAAFGVGKAVGRLDAYQSGLWSACSVDQLIGGKPQCMGAVNNSNSQVTTIQFSPDGTVNAGALTAHCGTTGSSGAIYDQSSAQHLSGNLFNTGTASKRPTVVSGSSSLGYLEFDASDDALATPTNFGGVTGCTVFMRMRLRSTAGLVIILEHSQNYNNDNAFIAYWDGGISRLVTGTREFAAARYANSEFNVSVTTEAVFCFRYDRTQTNGANQCVLFLNGVKQTRTGVGGETATRPTGNFGSWPIYLAGRNSTSLYAPMNLKTLVIYSTALSDADCTAISALL